MALMATRREIGEVEAGFVGDEARWGAVVARDGRADGVFVYAVRTTGVYCRPSCGARLARRENVEFYESARDAARAGFRACKRCRPDEVSAQVEHAKAVARACELITRGGEGTDLAGLASSVGMSPSHFHRLFKKAMGVTPKAYAMARRAERVREALPRRGSVTAAAYEAGFGSSGRFYASAGKTLGMTPSAYRRGGAGMRIWFAVRICSLGLILVAASEKGVCLISMGDDARGLERELKARFSKADVTRGDAEFEGMVSRVVEIVEEPGRGFDLPLDVRGTAFQQRVWQELSRIPSGETRTYAQIAAAMGEPRATRAVAGACGANPVAVVIPCHRVVGSDGTLTGYRWGVERKKKLLERERRVM